MSQESSQIPFYLGWSEFPTESLQAHPWREFFGWTRTPVTRILRSGRTLFVILFTLINFTDDHSYFPGFIRRNTVFEFHFVFNLRTKIYLQVFYQ